MRSVRNLGNIALPEPNHGEYVNYVLDGQQRLTSLFAALKGVTIKEEDGKLVDYAEIYIDLNATVDEEIVTTEIENRNPTDIIKLTDLMKGGLTLLAAYPQHHHKTLEHYKDVLTAYTFSIINLKNAPIDSYNFV